MHLNSGEGINEGLCHIVFDDDHEILLQTPPGEMSGLAVGDRRFNIKGKGLYIDKKNNYFCEMKFQDDGGFFNKKKRTYLDELTGDILKVRESFTAKFLSAPGNNKPSPGKSDIVESGLG